MPIPTTNLRFKYDFQNGSYPGSGTSVFDLSGNGVTANILVGGTYVSGPINYFDLNGDTNIQANNAAISTDTNITINVWATPSFLNDGTGYNNLISIGLDGSGTIPYIGANTVGGNYVGCSGGFGVGTVQTSDPTYTDTNEWYLYTLVSNSSFGTSFLVNGVVIGTNASFIRPQSAVARLGSYDSTSYRGYGKIGYADFHNTSLSAATILSFYNESKVDYDNLVTFKYDFSDPACYPGTGNTIYDLSGNGIDATFTSGTASSYVGAGTSSYFNFDGTGYITSDTYANPTPTRWTMLCWVNFSVTSPYGLIMSTAESNVPGGVPHTVWGLTANTIASSNANGIDSISNPSTSNLNEWYMVTYTSDATTLRLYVNETEVGSTTRTIAEINGTSPYVRLAQYAGALDNALIGKIAYAEFYAGVGLSASQISTIFNNEASRFIPSPPAYQGIVGGRQFAQGFNG